MSEDFIVTDVLGRDIINIHKDNPRKWWKLQYHTNLSGNLSFSITLISSWLIASCIYIYILVTGLYITPLIALYLSAPYLVSVADLIVIIWGSICFLDYHRVRRYLKITEKGVEPKDGYNLLTNTTYVL